MGTPPVVVAVADEKGGAAQDEHLHQPGFALAERGVPVGAGRHRRAVHPDHGAGARFYGSMGGQRLNAPVRSPGPDADGVGYWRVASDGGIFAFEAASRSPSAPPERAGPKRQ